MEEIIEKYGLTILDTIVMAMLMIFLFANIEDDEGNKGIMNIVGAHMQTYSIDYTAYDDFDVYEVEAAKPAPEIKYIPSHQMYVGTNNISAYFSATSHTGANLRIKIIDITDVNGNSIMETAYSAANETITFTSEGIYTIRMLAVDEINKKTTVDIDVPVSET